MSTIEDFVDEPNEGQRRAPERVQRKRTKGWRMPANTVYVGRGTEWGNPARVEHCFGDEWLIAIGQGHYPHFDSEEEARHEAVRMYREYFIGARIDRDEHVARIRRELAGKNLACWCALDQPCHADVLLELANKETEK